MARIESSCVAVSHRAQGLHRSGGVEPTVVWLRGDHDSATVAPLIETLVEVIASDDADLILDLSDVGCVGGATIEVLVRAREFLRLHERSLRLRAPPTGAWPVLDLCRDAGLLDPLEVAGVAAPADALRAEVAAPVTARDRRAASMPGRKNADTSGPGGGRVTSHTAGQSEDGRTTRVAGHGGR